MKPEVATAADAAPLFRFLEGFSPLSENCMSFFRQHLELLRLPKRKFLLKEGELCKHVYFIRKGAVRGFFKEGAKEITTWITVENEMVTAITALVKPLPVSSSIQLLENSELLSLPIDIMEQAYTLFPEFNIVARKLLQQYYADAELRACISRLTNAKSKYQYFQLHHPALVNRIPLKYIASYLGITLETLSRIRAKKAGK